MKKMRENFLISVYKATGGSSSTIVNMFDVGTHLGLSNVDTSRIFEYLEGENLLKAMTLGGGVGITHEGVKAVETGSILSDTAPIAMNTYIINNTNSPGAQIGMNSIQNMQNPGSLPALELTTFISKLKEVIPTLDLSEEDKEAVDSDLKLLEKQVLNPESDPGKVKSRFRTLMKSLSEKVAVQTLAGQFPTVVKWMKEMFDKYNT